MRRAEFWTDWSFEMAEGEAFGCQAGAAYVMRDFISDLKVSRRVSFWWPHDVPVRARRMFSLAEALLVMEEMWGEKVKCVSSVTPRMRGRRQRGMADPFIVTAGSVLD